MDNSARRIIKALGGSEAVAKIIGITPVRVRYWSVAREKGGAGGNVPTKHQQALLDHARANGIDLKPEDFFDKPAPSGEEAA